MSHADCRRRGNNGWERADLELQGSASVARLEGVGATCSTGEPVATALAAFGDTSERALATSKKKKMNGSGAVLSEAHLKWK